MEPAYRDKGSLKGVFVSWARPVPRAKNIADALGIKNYYVVYMKGAPAVLLPLRYLLQSIRTWSIFLREKPDVVLVTNPPIVLPLMAYLYSKVRAGGFVIDSHTGAFRGIWGRFLFLHRFLSKKAITTVVTNNFLRNQVLSWGARANVLEDKIPDLPVNRSTRRFGRFSICVISSFAEDEPFEEVLEAARNMPQYDFYFTGNLSRVKSRIFNVKSANVFFTGFLPDSEYLDLLNKVDCAVVLVKNDLTMLCGAYESVAVEKPLITSNWPVLRNYFTKGTLYVNNDAASIEKAIHEAALRNSELAKQMKKLKKELNSKWNERFKAFVSCIE